MFDVDWSDPHRESVGDRRARKQKEKEVGDRPSNKDSADKDSKRDEQSSQASGSGSVRSSMSSVDKQFGFFGGKNRKKGWGLGNTKSTASSTTGAPTILEQGPTEDNNDGSNNDSRPEVSPTALEGSETVRTEDHRSSVSGKYFLGLSEAIFNTWNESLRGGSLLGYDMASPKPGLRSTLTQHLGDGVSFITKTTEVRSQPRGKNEPDYLVSKVTLSAGPSPHEPNDLSARPSPRQTSPQAAGVTHSLATVPESTAGPILEDAHHAGPTATGVPVSPASNQTPTAGGEPRHTLKRKPKAPLKAPAIVPACQQYVGNPDLWKAPDVWEYSASEPEVSPVEEAAVPFGADDLNQLALDMASMQREAARMLQASPETVLRRLKESWGDGQDARVAQGAGAEGARRGADAGIDRALMYKELEMDRKRWMLSALHNMETHNLPNAVLSKPKVRPKVQKILSLFDSQAATSYHAISNPGVPIYHLSPDPLSHRRYPNIHPMTCPAISASAVGVATEAFSAVNCLPIASILPSSDLPRLLQNIFRVLAPGGFLNMVIVDPLPDPASAGPQLRRWLDENLIFNLEQQFRCTNPSRNFPVWLLEAGMRAKGSVITHARFQAVLPPPRGERGGESSEAASAKERELRTAVGRMLWQEIWGPFVGADRWWWEVPKIVDECVSRETYWDYSLIAACKEGEP